MEFIGIWMEYEDLMGMWWDIYIYISIIYSNMFKSPCFMFFLGFIQDLTSGPHRAKCRPRLLTRFLARTSCAVWEQINHLASSDRIYWMCVYIYIYIMHVNISWNMYIYIYVYIYTYICTHTDIYMIMYVCVWYNMCIIYVYCVPWSSVGQLVKFKNGPGMPRKKRCHRWSQTGHLRLAAKCTMET